MYVSYTTLPDAVDDAHYTVFHSGGKTEFRVNQRMGGGTWLYLGTFLFEAGENERARVVLDNASSHKGHISADAVRFGGGMGMASRSMPEITISPDATTLNGRDCLIRSTVTEKKRTITKEICERGLIC